MKKNPATLSDIANQLNISISTVSRALHDHPAINKNTKRRVIKLAEKLDYQPNMLALSLLNKKTNTIGIIVPEITSYFFSSVINGIQDLVNDAGYRLIISQSEESFEKEKKILEALSRVRVDGFLISPTSETHNASHFNKLIKSGTPLVIFDRDCEGFNADKVLVDDYNGAFQAVEHLISSGCRRIAHITGPPNLSISKHRLHGYLDALKKYNIPKEDQLIFDVKGFTPEFGVEAAKAMMKLPQIPDAIFAINDGIAIGAMYVIKEAGIQIPNQISVVGFDDEPHSSYFIPPLTSVWQPVYDMGLLSARILLSKLKGEKPAETRYEMLKPELIVRASSRKLTV
ncbi:MAG: LacI family DNA-binding transcriptional regulator [Cyclobacteriaceae bacterium]|nr:LacI family DNA-binding transcriptional regulator [Cyclobacteriaceae bacterium]